MIPLKNIRENDIYFADFETSYINEEQLLIGGSETVESRRQMINRERYVNVAGIMGLNDSDVTLIENGKDTLKDFIEYLIDIAKMHYEQAKKDKKKTYKKVVVYFHNLEYDFSYIQYYLCQKYNGLRQKTNNISYEELRDETGIYCSMIRINERLKENKYKTIKDKKYQKYYTDGTEMKKYKSIDIYFYDSYKIFPMSIANIGKTLGYYKDEYDYLKIRDYNYKLTDEEREYVKRDVLILQRFYKSVPIYSVEKMTLASNCMKHYKDISYPININGYNLTFEELFMQSKNDKFNKLSTFKGDKINEFKMYTWEHYCEKYQTGYCGGITQVNEMFQGKFIINKDYINSNKVIKELKQKGLPYIKTDKEEVIIDINSLYPSIMYTSKIPYGRPKIYVYPSDKFIKDNLKDKVIFCKIVDVYGNLKKNKMPIIPKNRFLKQGSSELYFKDIDGEIFYVNYEEFLLWKEHYNIDYYLIEECLIFDSVKDNIFKTYINKFYEMKKTSRAKGDKINEKISKLMLNSLYGKFGTNPNKKHQQIYYNGNEWVTLTNEQYYYIDDDGEKIYMDMNNKGEFIYPFLASAITSYARMFLINCIDKIPYDKFIYCDTDSIHFIDNDIYGLADFKRDGLISKDEMLKYSIEDKSLCSIYLAPKKYAYIDMKNKLNVKCAGLPNTAQENITNISEFYYGYTTCDKNAKKRIKGGIDLVPTLYQIKPPKDMKIQYNKIQDSIQV